MKNQIATVLAISTLFATSGCSNSSPNVFVNKTSATSNASTGITTLPPVSQLIPGTYFGLQTYYGMSPSYASSDGQYVGFWQRDSTGVNTWIQNTNGNKWRVSPGKYYIVGSTPSGGVIFSNQKPSDPNFTSPSFVFQPKTSRVSSIPRDTNAKITQYASESINDTWATIELRSNGGGFEDSWVDVNGKRVPWLDHAQEIAWSPDGSKLAVLIAVDATPRVKGLRAWSVVQNEIAIYDDRTGKIARTKEYGMSGLSWSPDGQIIAVNCGETTQTSFAGFYEFQTYNLQKVQQFSSILPRDWSWLGGHTALVSSGQSKSWNLTMASWNLKTGATDTSNILQTTNILYGLRTAGAEQCLVQDQQGLLLVDYSKVTRIVSQPVRTWWYDKSTQEVLYVVTSSNDVRMMKL